MEKKWRKTVQAAFLQCFYNCALKYVKQLQVLGYIALVKHHITKSIKNNWCLYEYGKRLQFIIGHWPIASLVYIYGLYIYDQVVAKCKKIRLARPVTDLTIRMYFLKVILNWNELLIRWTYSKNENWSPLNKTTGITIYWWDCFTILCTWKGAFISFKSARCRQKQNGNMIHTKQHKWLLS